MSFLIFKEIKDTGKTKVFDIISASSGAEIGVIQWFSNWRRYCFYPDMKTIWDVNCLKEVSEFINTLMEERKGKLSI